MRILAISLCILLLPVALFGQTQPHNDPLAIIAKKPKPNVLMLMDASGSMMWDSLQVSGRDISVRKENLRGGSTELLYVVTNYAGESNNAFLQDADNVRSRIKQAKDATREIISQITDINIGIGQFKRALKLNRFRATLPADLDQTAGQDSNYYYYYWDSQTPATGQINIPYRRKPKYPSTALYEYPYFRTVRRDSGVCWSWDFTDIRWRTTTSDTTTIDGQHFTRANWGYSYVENARYEAFRNLTADGSYIYRGAYTSPNATHRNKLNQVDNLDIFLTDTEFLELKNNTPLGGTLQVERYVESAYGVSIGRTLTFTFNPLIADYDTSTSCAGGEMLVGIQDEFLDDPDTEGVDESDNKQALIATTGLLRENAKIYDFSVTPATLIKRNTFMGVGNTPLADTLTMARNYFTSTINTRDTEYNVASCRDNYIILLTDGFETCGGTPESVAGDIWENYGIKVYVIVFCSDPSQGDAIAAAGGTEQAFTAADKDELITALQAIFSEIKASVELSAPVAVTSSTTAGDFVEGNVTLLPFFDFPGFAGRLQARALFRHAVVEVDPKTGAIVVDGEGNPTIIEDNLTDERILELVNDPDNPIGKDPSREIVGLQHDPPQFLWDAGELLSRPVIDDSPAGLVYPHLQPDTADVDGDGDLSEEIINPAYQTADARRILTALEYDTDTIDVIEFDVATLIDDSSNRDQAKLLLGVSGWSDDEARFLVNYARGKTVQRFTTVTELYGTTFDIGDPIPTGTDGDGDGIPDDFLYAERNWKLGDIIGSSPVLIRPPSGTFPLTINDNDNSLHDFDEFVETHKDNPSIVVVGANDGMLHAFTLNGIDDNDDGDFDDSGDYYPGEQVWAFVLPTTMYKIKELFADSPEDEDIAPDGQKLDPHQYFVDGQIALAVVRARIHSGDTDGDGKTDDPEFRMVMLFGEGRGGTHYWMFDVTDPMNPKPAWTSTDSTMGLAISRPAVGAVRAAASPSLDNDTFQYFAFVGSGYDFAQTDGNATVGNVIYKLDISTGAIVESHSVGDESGGAGIPNAVVGRAILVDENDDYLVDRAYFSDLDGNIWRWNLLTSEMVNILDIGDDPIATDDERLNRPIADAITYANIFGFHIVTAATGGDTRVYLDANRFRKEYEDQRIYLIVDTNREGEVQSLLNGVFNEDGDYESTGSTNGIDLPEYMIGENQPVVTSFTEYDEEGKIYRGFQTFYPIYTPDAAGLRSVRCSFGSSDLLLLDSIFSESSIVSSTTGTMIDMGEGKATGITYTGGNILFSIGDQFKVYGSGIYRFESSQIVKARLKVLSWKEIF